MQNRKFRRCILIMGFLILVFGIFLPLNSHAVSDVELDLPSFRIPFSKINPIIQSLKQTSHNVTSSIKQTTNKVVTSVKSLASQTQSAAVTLASLRPDDVVDSFKTFVSPPAPVPIKILPPSLNSTQREPIIQLVKEKVDERQLLASLRTLLLRPDIKQQLRGDQGLKGEAGEPGLQGPPGPTSAFAPLSPPSFAPPSYNNGQIVGNSGG